MISCNKHVFVHRFCRWFVCLQAENVKKNIVEKMLTCEWQYWRVGNIKCLFCHFITFVFAFYCCDWL